MVNHSEFMSAFRKSQNEIFICSWKEDPSGGLYYVPGLIRRRDLVDKLLQDELHIAELSPKAVFWTDSTTVLQYLRNETKAFHIFVANRIRQIKDIADVVQWYYVFSVLHVGDDTTRGMSITNFLKSERCKRGPNFLWKEESVWSTQPMLKPELDCEDPKVKTTETVCIAASCQKVDHFMNELTRRFSSWYKLKRICCWILRAKNRFKALITTTPDDENMFIQSVIMPEEMEVAQRLILKYVQLLHYANEMADLAISKAIKKSSSLLKLDPFLQN